MIRVLIIGDNPFRIKDQILLCEELLTINPNYKFTFLIVNKRLKPFFLNVSNKITYILIGGKANKDGQNNINIFENLPFALTEFIMFLLIIFDLYKNYFRIKKVVNRIKPNLILTNKDSNIGIEPVLLKIAKEKKIKVIVPYFVYSDNIGIAELYSRRESKKKSKSPLTKIIMKLLPKQVIVYKNKKFLFYSPAFTVAYKLFGTLSNNPWITGNGLSDIICVDTRHTLKRYTHYKIPKNKLLLVGDVTFDKLYVNFNKRNRIKELILNKYKLNKKRKNIVISLPQLAELGFVDHENHLREIDFILKTIQKINCNILISLHPRMNPLDYQYLEKRYDCKIIKERLYDFISIADLFISTYSSTVIWSVLCKVKSVVTNFNQLHYSMYDFLQSVSVAHKKNKFKEIINTCLAEEIDFSKDWKELSRSFIFDGHTIKRYNKLFIESSTQY